MISLNDFYDENTTISFKKAIEHLASIGGGELVVPPGTYMVGSIELKSNICLNLEPGAEIVASPNYEDFSSTVSSVKAEESYYGFIFARDCSNISIKGLGEINGNALSYNDSPPDDFGYIQPKKHRPRTIVFENCSRISLKGFSIVNAPMWTIHLIACADGLIDGLSVDNGLEYSNTDAINLDGSRNFRISNCFLRSADDGICLKTSVKPKDIDFPCENIVVSNCVIESHSSAIKIGTETYNDFKNITISNCVITRSNRGVSIVSRDGGSISSVNVSNLIIETSLTKECHWGKSDPIYISSRCRNPSVEPGVISDIFFSNIHIKTEGAINFHSETLGKVKNIKLAEITIQQNYTNNKERGCFDLRPPCNPYNSSNDGMDNAYVIEAGSSRPYGVHEYKGGLPAFYSEGILESEIGLINFNYTQDEKGYWNDTKVLFV
ncbi:glycoside hydrolase family 28 protein [Chromohalobacter beijerinckii]|uniref:Glycoside hydrolase family 28 protein n=1 Tax=Chromohalobacter beijerinckii TaxID=86179 RepID=A0ABV8XAQ3_9GAMM|nr:glycosyl hydrolase family 28 protein [Chromohalobacter beijerinckii]MCK0766793.1 glycosyl hydrolase family 28 protein [Chromohalobacter beijerinckii]